jgi:hypothetical protein
VAWLQFQLFSSFASFLADMVMGERVVKCTQEVNNWKKGFRKLVSITHAFIFRYTLSSKKRKRKRKKAQQFSPSFPMTYTASKFEGPG